MAGKTDAKRLVDLTAALKKAKPKDVVTLETLSAIWGVAKPRFVTVARNFIDWPEPVGKEGNAYLLPAQKCFRSMIDYLKRHEAASKSRATRLGALIGSDQMAEQIAGGFSIAELARANQLAAELEQRQREQGLYIPVADVQRTIGLVFSEISEFLSNLSNYVDPHGNRLPPAVRAAVDTAAHEQLLSVHAKLRGMLSPDVKPEPTRKPARKPRKAPARRKGKRSGPRKT